MANLDEIIDPQQVQADTFQNAYKEFGNVAGKGRWEEVVPDKDADFGTHLRRFFGIYSPKEHAFQAERHIIQAAVGHRLAAGMGNPPPTMGMAQAQNPLAFEWSGGINPSLQNIPQPPALPGQQGQAPLDMISPPAQQALMQQPMPPSQAAAYMQAVPHALTTMGQALTQQANKNQPSQEIRDWLLANDLSASPTNVMEARKALQHEAITQEGGKALAREMATPGRAETREKLLGMGFQNPADATPKDWNTAIAAVNEQHKEVSAESGARAVMLKPLDDNAQNAIISVQVSKDVVRRLLTEFTPQERANYAGVFKYPLTQWAQYFKDDPKFARFTTLLQAAKASAFDVGGKQLTPFEASVVFGYVPTGTEMSPSIFEAKLRYANERFDAIVNNRINLAITPKTEAYKLRPKSENIFERTKPK